MPLSAVKPGMVGEALTVFQGTKPEPFKIRVVSVLRNFLPKQDVILIRAEDPRVEHSGIVAGMSGSPVYIDGKLVGAVAYAWSFAKEPLGGVTPIETMLGERARPRRSGKEVLAEGWSAPDTSGKSGGSYVSAGVPHASLAPQSDGPAALARGLGLPPAAPTLATGEPRLLRASVPLSVSGFTARTVAELSDALAPHRSRAAAGGRRPQAGPAGRGPRRAGLRDRRRAGARRREHRRDRHRHLRRRAQRACVRPPAVRHRRGLPADGRRADPRVPAQPGAVVQDVVAAQRGRHAGAGPPVVHHRRPRCAQHDAADRRAASAAPAANRAASTPRWRATAA